MKISPTFLRWIQGEFHRRQLTYIGLSRLSKGRVSYGAWHNLLTGKTQETHEETDEVICQLFNVTPERLRQIAAGEVPVKGPEFGVEAERCLALWRWLRYDPMRIAIVKAMGYEGDLPEPYRASRPE